MSGVEDVSGPQSPITEGRVSSFKSSHSCRVCGFWSEGLWATDRERAEREMARGCCDNCYVCPACAEGRHHACSEPGVCRCTIHPDTGEHEYGDKCDCNLCVRVRIEDME